MNTFTTKIDRFLRERVKNETYWKNTLFGINLEDLIKEAIKLRYIAGVYGKNKKPS